RARGRAVGEVRWRGGVRSHCAWEQRLTGWRGGQGHSATRVQQEAELRKRRAAVPQDAPLHSHVWQDWQDVLARLDRTYQAFFWRVQAGEQSGFPRFPGRGRSHSFPFPFSFLFSFLFTEDGKGGQVDPGALVGSRSGRLAVRWRRRVGGRSKTVTILREAEGWCGGFSCADVPPQPLAPPGRETGTAGAARACSSPQAGSASS